MLATLCPPPIPRHLILIAAECGIVLSGLVLYAGMRVLLKNKINFWKCQGISLLAMLAGAIVAIGYVFVVDDDYGDIYFLPPFIIFIILSGLSLKVLHRLPADKAIKVWLPVLIFQIALFVASAIGTSKIHQQKLQPFRLLVSEKRLRNVREALLFYECNYDGKYPPKLADVLSDDWISKSCLHYPGKENQPYFYVRPQNNYSSNALLICESQPQFNNTRAVLFQFGDIKRVTEPEFQKLLAKPENKAFAEAYRKTQIPEQKGQE